MVIIREPPFWGFCKDGACVRILAFFTLRKLSQKCIVVMVLMIKSHSLLITPMSVAIRLFNKYLQKKRRTAILDMG